MEGREVPITVIDERDEQREWREEEQERTLMAIAGAIVSGRLTPDDAFAWARIAACEVAGRGR